MCSVGFCPRAFTDELNVRSVVWVGPGCHDNRVNMQQGNDL